MFLVFIVIPWFIIGATGIVSDRVYVGISIAVIILELALIMGKIKDPLNKEPKRKEVSQEEWNDAVEKARQQWVGKHGQESERLRALANQWASKNLKPETEDEEI